MGASPGEGRVGGPGRPLPVIPGVELLSVLGAGHTSVVYLGRQQGLDREVAVKVLGMPIASDLARRLFDNERRILGRLAPHPNILTVFGSGATGEGSPYLVAEYLPGGDLEELLAERGPMGWAEVAEVGVQLAGALATAHAHGIVHGDLRLRNVLRSRAGQPVLGDFGISTLATGAGPPVVEVTSRLAAPEVRAGADPTELTDVYGLAGCLLALLGPAPGADAAVPPELRDLLAAASDPDPQRRPQSARAFGEALRSVQAAHGRVPTDLLVLDDLVDHGSDRPTGAPAPARRAGAVAARRRAVRAAGLAVLVVACAASVAALMLWDPRQDAIVSDAVPGTSTEPAGPDGAEPAPQQGLAFSDQDAGEPRAPAAPASSEELPQSEIQGVQPGIDYDVRGVDTSAELAFALSEERTIFLPLEGRPVQESPYYAIPFERFPAAFHFQAFNPEHDGQTCTGMMSRELVATGMWERRATWPDGVLQVSVGQFADAEMAHEMATALSLTAGAKPSQCRGMAGFGVEDEEDFGVLHRDTLRLLPPGDTYNHWSGSDVTLADQVWPESTRMVLQRGPFVVDVGLLTREPLGMGDDQAVAEIAEQVINRL